MTLFELDEAANVIRDQVDPDANIIVGSCLDPDMVGRIRVSVVATGIDAAEAEMATPLPRRDSGSRTVRDVPAKVAVAAPKPPAAVTAPEPVRVAAQAEPEVIPFEAPATEDAEGDLPPPAYRPAPRPAPVVAAPAAFAATPESFVAPRPRVAGQPSPETLARLREVAAKGPRAVPGAERGGAAAARRPGLGSLIGRMTGHAEPGAGHGGAAFEAEAPQDERIEIPAFLRRQAN